MFDSMASTKLSEGDRTNIKMIEFLVRLGELSRQFGVGIAGQPVLFIMEENDFDREYHSDTESRIEFR